jgi:uncharacterized protein YbdZ (MbtH family)/microcystin-dependent protein
VIGLAALAAGHARSRPARRRAGRWSSRLKRFDRSFDRYQVISDWNRDLYSIWPEFEPKPPGWRDTGDSGDWYACVNRVVELRNQRFGFEGIWSSYKVIVNDEEQYSIWPVDSVRDGPRGWRDADVRGTAEECFDYIDGVWTDWRPLSLRKRMEAEAARRKVEEEARRAADEARRKAEEALPEAERRALQERRQREEEAKREAEAAEQARRQAEEAAREAEEAKRRYRVIVNVEEQYTIWPADQEVLKGWHDAGKEGVRQECLDYIDQVWTDRRSLSVRKLAEEQERLRKAAEERNQEEAMVREELQKFMESEVMRQALEKLRPELTQKVLEQLRLEQYVDRNALQEARGKEFEHRRAQETADVDAKRRALESLIGRIGRREVTPGSDGYLSEPMIGEIRLFAGDFAPTGWAMCDGQQLPIAHYSALYSVIGVQYGGDGLTWFALPDLRGRVPVHRRHGQFVSRTLGDRYDGDLVSVVGSGAAFTRTASDLCVSFIIAIGGLYPTRPDNPL